MAHSHSQQLCSHGKNNKQSQENESYKQNKMIKEERLLLIMGAVRYIRKEGDKRTESFVPKLDE